MPSKMDGWPEEFGFTLYGRGPTFIVAVGPDSVAEESGLQPGDQLLQVANESVEKWSATRIKEFVSRSSLPPPSLGVVSRLKDFTLPYLSSKHEFFGLKLIGSVPVVISHVELGSPAHYSNLKPNDILIKVSGKYVSSSLQALRVLESCKHAGRAQVGVITVPVSEKASPMTAKPDHDVESKANGTPGQLKARSFLNMVKTSFENHPFEIQKIVSSIQEYSARKDVERFASDVSSSFLLVEDGYRLLDALKFFIPLHHKDLFNLYLEKYWVGRKQENYIKGLFWNGKMIVNSSIWPASGKSEVSLQHDSEVNYFCQSVRSVSVKRGSRPLGVTVCGHSPVVVQSVERGSPADEAGIKDGDSILALNGIDIRSAPHWKAVALIQGSGSMPTLVIQTTSGAVSQAGPSGLPYSLYTNTPSPPSTSCFAPTICTDLLESTNQLTAESCGLSNRRNPSNGIAETAWTSKYIPDDLLIGGKTFKEQIAHLLTNEQIVTLRNGFVEFASHRNIDNLLFQLHPILSCGSDSGREVVWLYVLHSLTAREWEKLRRRLYELADVVLPDCNELSKSSSLSDQRLSGEATSNLSAPSTGNEESKISGKRSRRRQSARSLVIDGSKTEESKSQASVETSSTNNSSGSTPRRRYRRRRTVANIHLTPAELAEENEHDPQQEPTSCGPGGPDDLPSDSQQQEGRRRRREMARTSRRRCSVGVVLHHAPDGPPPSESHSSSKDPPSHKYGVKGRAMSEEALLRRERRRSRKTMESVTMTTTEEVKETLVGNFAQASTGDKKKKKSESTQEKSGGASTLPASSIDDIVFEDSPRKKDASNHHGANSTHQYDRRTSESNLQGIENKNGNTANNQIEERFFLQDGSFSSERSPNFNSIFLDDSKQKPGYLSSLKKRLTFSRPPKNNDTDTFLCELSTQFDEEMNLVDDIEIVEDDKQDLKFGEKWSYLPKSEPKEDINMDIITDFLNETNFGGNFNGNNSTPSLSSAADNNCRIVLDKKTRTVSVSSNNNNKHNDEFVPPFPVSSEDIEPIKLEPSQVTVANIPPPVDTSTPAVVKTQSRAERVRRRRRRNAEAKRSEETSVAPDPQERENSIRRVSDPCPSVAPTENVSSPSYQDDKVIYDVPKAVAPAQRRAHVNVVTRSRRSRLKRSGSVASKRNSTELRMHVWTENDLTDSNPSEMGSVKLRSPSPVEQSSFFERAKKKNYRVSGISIAMDDIFSDAEQDLHNRSFEPRSSPPLPVELENTPKRSNVHEQDDIYAPLQEEVLALGLAYDEQEGEEEEYQTPQTSSIGTNTVSDPFSVPSPPPAPPAIPPPPPVPISPPLMFKNTPPTSPVRMSVKRINWEKIEPVDLGNTVWGQLGEDHDTINDVVKYLDLEEHFAMKKAKDLKQKKVEVKKDIITILAHKKAYNTSILLAHLKLSHRQICECLSITGSEATRRKMEASHYQTLLMYAPDKQETEKLREFKGDARKLNEADILALKLVNIPGYNLRLKALVFKHSFAEKEEEIQKNLGAIQRASIQLRKSRKLAKILEFVLAMGNYMNRGHIRISKATGFRIQFLAEMDSTKTSDNKLTFLHILARAVISKFPDVVTFTDEIPDVQHAARVIYPAVLEELQDLRKVWLDIRDNLHEAASKSKLDKFKIAMETCLVRTNGSIKRLEQLHNATVKEFRKVAQYFGENPKNVGMQQFFKIFDEFTRKFTRSSGEVRKFVKSRPTGR